MKSLVLTLGMALLTYLLFSQNSSKEHYTRQLDELNISISKDAGNLSLYYSRADVYDVLNDFEHANSDYRQVVDLYQRKSDSKYKGEYAKSCYRLADDYFFRSSNREKALKYVTKGLDVAPDFKDLEILEAILLGLDPAKSDVVREKYSALSAKYPDDIRLTMYYAKFLVKSAPIESAALYEKAIAADPLNQEALLSAATIYNNEATRLSEAVISDPTLVFVNAKKAVFYFEKLYKQNPSDKELTNVLFRLYDELDEQDKAAELRKVSVPY